MQTSNDSECAAGETSRPSCFTPRGREQRRAFSNDKTDHSGACVWGVNGAGKTVLQVPVPANAVGRLMGLVGRCADQHFRALHASYASRDFQKVPTDEESDAWFGVGAQTTLRAIAAPFEIEVLIMYPRR